MILDERFELGDLLGQGGAAEVYAARDLEHGRECAVKVLQLKALGDSTERLRKRLRQEARLLMELRHPHVVSVFAVGQDGERDYLAMELATRGSLGQFIEDNGPLAPKRAAQVVLQIAGALEAAHALGIVHRDVKPDNLLQFEDGSVKLADFGIAVAGPDATRNTRAGVALGSLSYMAPEQRLAAHNVGPAADQYALGATLYFLLTAQTPMDLFLAGPSSPRFEGLPLAVVALIRRATAQEPDTRFTSLADLAQGLKQLLPDLPDEPFMVQPEMEPSAGYEPTAQAGASEVPALPRVSPSRRETATPPPAATRPSPGPRNALVVSFGALLVLVAALVALMAANRLESLQLATAERVAGVTQENIPVEVLLGRWEGPFGERVDQTATLTLQGTAEALTGDLVVHLGEHELLSRVSGRFDESTGELVLEDLGNGPNKGRYLAQVQPQRVMTGRWRRDGQPDVRFTLVRLR